MKSLTDSRKWYFRAHFHQKQNTEMIRKFALLATAAALMVACGGATEEEMKAKAQAEADSIAKVNAAKMEAEAAAAKAKADSIAAAAMDTTMKAVEGAVTPAGH